MRTAKIVRFSKIGESPTKDLTVDSEDRVFYAGGVVVSNSHAVCYGLTGYQTAYLKAHTPERFFNGWLKHAKGKPKPLMEVNELVSNARSMGIQICPPSITKLNKEFKIFDGCPTFGLTDIKGIGESTYNDICNVISQTQVDPADVGWEKFLTLFGPAIDSRSMKHMIECGYLDHYKVARNEMIYVYQLYSELSDKYKTYLKDNFNESLIKTIKRLAIDLPNFKRHAHTARHIEMVDGIISALEHPPYALVDKPEWKAKKERDLLGIEVSSSELDSYDTKGANCSCMEYIQGFESKAIKIAAKIKYIKKYKTKRGQNKGKELAFLTVSDGFCTLDNITVFCDELEKFDSLLTKDNLVILHGTRDKNQGSFIIKNVKKLKERI